jgi:anti-sigma-K factor RskA
MTVHEQFADDLALYALGSLDGAERQALVRHLEDCSSCRRELELLRGDLGMLALTTAGPKPPARSRQRLMSAIANENRATSSRLPLAVATPAPPVRRRSWWPTLGWVAAAALVLLCVGLLRQNSTLQRNLASNRAQFEAQLNDQAKRLERTSEVVATLLDPEAATIELVAAGAKPQPHGKAIYQQRNRNLIFVASNLAPLPPERIYELWLFPANGGAPIAAGLFKPDARGSATVVDPPLPQGVEAKNFVVTLEPDSGSHESPRGTPVIVGLGAGE